MTVRAAVICDRTVLDRLFGVLELRNLSIVRIFTNILGAGVYKGRGLSVECVPACHIDSLSPQDADLVLLIQAGHAGSAYDRLLARGFEARQILDLDVYMTLRDAPGLLTAMRLVRERRMAWRGLATGLSYFRAGLLPQTFDHQLLNLAGDSQDLFYDLALAERALAAPGHGIDYAVIGLAPYSLSFDLSLSDVAWRCIKYAPTLGDDRGLTAGLPLQLNQLFGPQFFTQEAPNAAAITQADFHTLFTTSRQEYFNLASALRGREQAERWARRSYPATEAANAEILDRYLDLCRRAGVNAFLVLPPMSRLFRTAYPDDRYAAFCARLEAAAARPHVHFRSFYDLTDEVQDFYDGDHLSTKGAEKFSRELRGWIEATLAG